MKHASKVVSMLVVLCMLASICLTFTIATPVKAAGNTYYMALTGSDTNDGSIDHPWRSLAYANQKLNPGDTLYIRGGTYVDEYVQTWNASGAVNAPITVAAFPGESPVLVKDKGYYNGSSYSPKANAFNIKGSQYLTIDGLTFKNYMGPAVISVGEGVTKSGVMQNAEYVTIRNCKLLDNGDNTVPFNDHAIYVTTNAYHLYIYNNWIQNTAAAGIHLNVSAGQAGGTDYYIYNNVFIGPGYPGSWGIITEPNYRNLYIYNNTFYNLDRPIDISNYSSGLTPPYPNLNYVIKNNVIYSTKGVALKVHELCINSVTEDNNLYYDSTTSTPIAWGYNSNYAGAKLSAADLRASTNNAIHSIQMDPSFKDISSLDFHLNPNSPAIDSGTTISMVTSDYDGNSRPLATAYDMGAYEFSQIPTADSFIYPSSAAFDKDVFKQKDIPISMVVKNNTLNGISYGGYTLVQGKDYTVSGSVCQINKEYLAALPVGNSSLVFDFSNGADPQLSVNITDTGIYTKADWAAGTISLGTGNAGKITSQFDVYAGNSSVNGIIGYADSDTAVNGLSSLAMSIQMLSTQGYFKVANGAQGFSCLTQVPYSSGNTYHFRIESDLNAKTYSVYVTPKGGVETIIASNYSFLSDAPSTDDLGKLVLKSDTDNAYSIGNNTIIRNSDIDITSAVFNKNPDFQADIIVNIFPNGHALIGIKNGSTALTKNLDYSVAGNVVTIRKSYLATLAEGTTVTLTFDFSEGIDPTLAINIINTAPPVINPTTAVFNKYPGQVKDITVQMSPNGKTFSSIINGSYTLVLDTDYTVAGDTVVIKKEYLLNLPLSDTTFTFKFSEGPDPVLSLSVINVESATISKSWALEDISPNRQSDVTVDMVLNEHNLVGLKNGSTDLVQGTDYTVTNNTVTLKSGYLAKLPTGDNQITFNFDTGSDPVLIVSVINSNLITNPGFETESLTAPGTPYGWVAANWPAGRNKWDNTVARSGSRSMEIYGNPDLNDKGLRKVTLSTIPANRAVVVPGRSYSVSVYVTSNTNLTSNGRFFYNVTWYKADGTSAGTLPTVNIPVNSMAPNWVIMKPTASITAPSNAVKLDIMAQIYNWSASTNPQIWGMGWLDDFELVEVGDARIDTTSATFRKNAPSLSDITVKFTPNGNGFNGINIGSNALVRGIDYVISADPTDFTSLKAVIKKEYLATLSDGDNMLSFGVNAGTNPVLKVSVDNTAPVTTLNVNGTGENGWFNSDVTASLSAIDNFSGVAQTEYKVGVADVWTAYTQPVVFSTEGTSTIQYRSTDTFGNVEDAKTRTVQIDKTAPTFTLEVNGNTLKDGDSFGDYQPLTFKASDSLSGLASAEIAIGDTTYKVDAKSQSSIIIDLAGQVGSYTAVVTLMDITGNKVVNNFKLDVKTSIASMKCLMDRFVKSGELSGPLVAQLTNNLDQAQQQLDIGSPDQAAKHMDDFVKHLNNKTMDDIISDSAKGILNADADVLNNIWSGKKAVI